MLPKYTFDELMSMTEEDRKLEIRLGQYTQEELFEMIYHSMRMLTLFYKNHKPEQIEK